MKVLSKYDVVIGIDPDVTKSGVCTYLPKEKKISVKSLTFPELIDYVFTTSRKRGSDNVLVQIEAGWKRKAHWHLNKRDNARLAAAKGNSTGRNHETGRKIVECLEYLNVNTNEIQPLNKCWRGTDGKITHEELQLLLKARRIEGLPSRTNQDARDSVLIAVETSLIAMLQ